jgi:hypothetical protein
MRFPHSHRYVLPIAAMLAHAVTACGCQSTVEIVGSTGSGGSGGTADAGVAGAGVAGAGVEDAGAPDADAGLAPLCPMDGDLTADVSGTTPLGDLSLPYAWLGYLTAECGGLILAISAVPTFEPGFMTQPDPPVLVFYDVGWDPMTGFVGAGEGEVSLTVKDTTVYSTGWIELTHVDPMPQGPLPEGAEYPRADGTITVMADGWSLSGAFSAPYCEHMDIYCP